MKCIGPTTTKAEIEPWKDEVLFSPQLDEFAEFLNLVGNSTRLKIVFLLTEFKELCVCDLAQILDITVPAVSQQLAKLKAFGLLKSRRENQTIFYSIADTRNVKLLKGRFDQILEQTQRTLWIMTNWLYAGAFFLRSRRLCAALARLWRSS